jgi:hypothetical protein
VRLFVVAVVLRGVVGGLCRARFQQRVRVGVSVFPSAAARHRLLLVDLVGELR